MEGLIILLAIIIAGGLSTTGGGVSSTTSSSKGKKQKVVKEKTIVYQQPMQQQPTLVIQQPANGTVVQQPANGTIIQQPAPGAANQQVVIQQAKTSNAGAITDFAQKFYPQIAEDDKKNGGEHLNSLILLMQSNGVPQDQAGTLVKKALKKANGKADVFAAELGKSL